MELHLPLKQNFTHNKRLLSHTSPFKLTITFLLASKNTTCSLTATVIVNFTLGLKLAYLVLLTNQRGELFSDPATGQLLGVLQFFLMFVAVQLF